MKNSKKGFSLIMAMMIVIVLVIMATGFISLVRYSRNVVNENKDAIKLYWLAESASNYNVKWWINQPDSVRKDWVCSYVYDDDEYSDIDGSPIQVELFPLSDDITEGGVVYLHSSTMLEGNIDGSNIDLEGDRYKMLNLRYKGERKGCEDEAVWILDSYVFDAQTSKMANVCMTNVYNAKLDYNLEPFINAEFINETLASAGFHGVKGRFNEQDVRYGPCFFGGLVHLDYTTGASKEGPVFYGQVKSSSENNSWWKIEGNLMDTTTDYGLGLGINGIIGDESEALALASGTLLGGYVKNVEPINADDICWSWDNVVNYAEEQGVYMATTDVFPAGSDINTIVRTEIIDEVEVTNAYIYINDNLTTPIIVLPLGDGDNMYTGLAVPSDYDMVTIEGVSGQDFSLVTETAQVYVTDDFYCSEMQDTYDWLYDNHDGITTDQPTEAILAQIWADMLTYDPNGHLAIIAGLNLTEFDKNTPPIYFPNEEFTFTTTSFITKFGELTAKGVGGTDLKLFNVGAVMVLDQQEIMTGPSDTAQQWLKVFIQDQRYLRPDETLPPMCGTDPEELDVSNLKGLNNTYRWDYKELGKVSDYKEAVFK